MRFRLFAALLLVSSVAHAASTACPQHFAGGASPELTNPKMAVRTHAICYEGFGLTTSGVSKTALWSAEYLTANRLFRAGDMSRENNFHEEESIPVEDRAVLEDYKRSGFDRGHMAPNGDMATRQSQFESFSLANMIPQNSKNNQKIWAGIEIAVRNVVKRGQPLYVVTGPAFRPDANGQLQSLHGRVLVPSHIWKAVFNPATGQAAAYWVQNIATSEYEVISMEELKRRIGIVVFPAAAGGQLLNLPAPERTEY